MRARSVFWCAPGTRDLWRSQSAPVKDALAAAWIREALTGEEPPPGALPPELWERARGMIRPVCREGGKA